MCHTLFLTLNYISLLPSLKSYLVENYLSLLKIFKRMGLKRHVFKCAGMVRSWDQFLPFKGDCSEGDTPPNYLSHEQQNQPSPALSHHYGRSLQGLFGMRD